MRFKAIVSLNKSLPLVLTTNPSKYPIINFAPIIAGGGSINICWETVLVGAEGGGGGGGVLGRDHYSTPG